MHVDAQGAVVDLGGADLHQLVQRRIHPAPRGRVQPDHRLVHLGCVLGPLQPYGQFGGVLRGRRLIVVRHALDPRNEAAQGYGPFPWRIPGPLSASTCTWNRPAGPAPRADRRPARGRPHRPPGRRHPPALLPHSRRRPRHRPQHRRRRLRRPRRRGLAHRAPGLRHPRRGPCRRPARRVGPAPPSRHPPRLLLRPGTPDLASFPRAEWLKAARRALTAAPHDALGYGDPRGRPELGPLWPATSPGPAVCAPTPNAWWSSAGSRTA
ncbi:hypothetical protein STENM36S_07646 [Streptomyces tendae]